MTTPIFVHNGDPAEGPPTHDRLWRRLYRLIRAQKDGGAGFRQLSWVFRDVPDHDASESIDDDFVCLVIDSMADDEEWQFIRVREGLMRSLADAVLERRSSRWHYYVDILGTELVPGEPLFSPAWLRRRIEKLGLVCTDPERVEELLGNMVAALDVHSSPSGWLIAADAIDGFLLELFEILYDAGHDGRIRLLMEAKAERRRRALAVLQLESLAGQESVEYLNAMNSSGSQPRETQASGPFTSTQSHGDDIPF